MRAQRGNLGVLSEIKKMLSCVILTKNEEQNIEDCIKSASWCDELIVIDDYSKDKTVEIAKRLGAKVFRRELNSDFAGQHNYGLDRVKGDWALFIHADERVPAELATEIKSEVQALFHPGGGTDTTPSGFFLKRVDSLWGQTLKHGETGNTRILRLARKGAGRWERKIHETWNIKGETRTLNTPLLHYPHQTIEEFLTDVNFYSTIHAEENKKEGKRGNLFKVIFFPVFKFVQNWLFKGGFLDGGAGFIAAFVMSFHSFLAWSKLYLEQRHP